jgi:hypothetical protein
MARNESDEETLDQAGGNQHSNDGGETGNKQQETGPVGFWHEDLKKTRHEVFKHWGITSRLAQHDVDEP